jgi:hypothetical protein
MPSELWSPGGVIVTVLIVTGTIVGAILVFTRGGRDKKQELNAYIDGRVEQKLKEAYLEIDTLTSKESAAARIFHSMALQAQAKGVVFDIDRGDAKILGETLPPIWQNKPTF